MTTARGPSSQATATWADPGWTSWDGEDALLPTFTGVEARTSPRWRPEGEQSLRLHEYSRYVKDSYRLPSDQYNDQAGIGKLSKKSGRAQHWRTASVAERERFLCLRPGFTAPCLPACDAGTCSQ